MSLEYWHQLLFVAFRQWVSIHDLVVAELLEHRWLDGLVHFVDASLNVCVLFLDLLDDFWLQIFPKGLDKPFAQTQVAFVNKE